MRDRSIKKQIAIFGAGCFWGVEYVFKKVPGVLRTEVGYIGGKTKNPSYKEVCTERTGHVESVRIYYDSSKISYQNLLEVFFKCHDPTQINRQGPDFGTQYRSVIFYLNEEQKKEAEEFKRKYEKEMGSKIATSIEKAGNFYLAEEYHQNYYEKNGKTPYCHVFPHDVNFSRK